MFLPVRGGQASWSLEQLNLVNGILPMAGGFETGWSLRSLKKTPTHSVIPWFSPWPDEKYLWVINELVEEIAKSWSIIFEKSWESGEDPCDWKRRNITPISKKEKKVQVCVTITEPECGGCRAAFKSLLRIRYVMEWQWTVLYVNIASV